MSATTSCRIHQGGLRNTVIGAPAAKQIRATRTRTSPGRTGPTYQPFQVSVKALSSAAPMPTFARSAPAATTMAASPASTAMTTMPSVCARSASASMTTVSSSTVATVIRPRRCVRMPLLAYARVYGAPRERGRSKGYADDAESGASYGGGSGRANPHATVSMPAHQVATSAGGAGADEKGSPVTLRAYLRVLRERWLIILVFVLVTTGVAVVVTALTPKSYEATAQVLVQSKSVADPTINNQAQVYASTQVPTLAKVIGAPGVIKYVQHDLHLDLSDRQVRGKLTAAAQTGTSIIDITASDGSAARAASLANSGARGFIQTVEGFNDALQLFLTGPADQPSSPSSPQTTLNILLGVLLGLLLGMAFAVIRDILDNRIKTPETLRKVSDAPVMAIVVEDSTTERHPIATRAGTRNVRAENFRQLRANLQFANVDEHPRVIAVTSSIPTEGKTMVAMNLASTVAKAMGLPSPVGLTSVLIHQIDLSEALQNAGSNLYVLSSGPTPPNPSEVL